ncbi:hypothetical protein Syun_028627 [Stephania yunnanensis]|uniref:Nitrogen regulatory protein P-II homolog n=1 Tax=Stephania yunnanensis TaxID=152371 RepID=A0AAP0HFD0_9MAGN
MASMAKSHSLINPSPLHSKRSSLMPNSFHIKLNDFQVSPPNLMIKRAKRATYVVPIKAQNVPDYVPDSKFFKIEAILSSIEANTQQSRNPKLARSATWIKLFRCIRFSAQLKGLLKMGIRGVTVSDVRGFGAQGGLAERQDGSEFSEDKFLAKVKMEVVVSKEQVEAVIDKIIEEARTGEIGDGKIFLIPVSDVIRVRTGERGEEAERMVGGRSDIAFNAN